MLSTVRYMIAIEMSREPVIRNYVRELFFQRACLTVRPTQPRGFNEIDESHPCYVQKYLSMKPCNELKRDEYLRLSQAEQDGLLTIKIELKTVSNEAAGGSKDRGMDEPPAARRNGGGDDDDWDDDGGSSSRAVAPNKPTQSKSMGKKESMSIADKIKSFYLKDEFSYTVEKWNDEKAKIVDELLDKFLYPEFERELKSQLLAEAKEYVFDGKPITRFKIKKIRIRIVKKFFKIKNLNLKEFDWLI